MTIDNLRELKALIALCRKTGVDVIKVDNIELHLSDYVAKPSRSKRSKAVKSSEDPHYVGGNEEEMNKILSDSLTQEQLLEWSLPNSGEGQ